MRLGFLALVVVIFAPLLTGEAQQDATGQAFDPKLYAYDKANGRLLAEVRLPANGSGAPMTYAVGGKQYVVFPVGGANIPEELIALSLP